MVKKNLAGTDQNMIKVKYEDRVVRVDNDAALKEFLLKYGRKGAKTLAGQILKEYKGRYQKELKITQPSLAAEIYHHFKIQEHTLAIEKRFGRSRPTKWMMMHMEVIDCGEREIDNNRFVWDICSVFWR